VRGATEADRNPAERVTRLIAQLGSPRYTEREAATRALDALGAPALAALKRARLGPDPEVGRRAEELVARIERRLETARLLEPKRVHLHLVASPVPDAVAELKRQSGYPVELGSGTARLLGRKVTLDTGLVPFWVALDLLCRQAGLSERGALL